MKEVDSYFENLKDNVDKNISNMHYTRTLEKYKENSKKSIVSLKGVIRSLGDQQKVMRTVIKYKA